LAPATASNSGLVSYTHASDSEEEDDDDEEKLIDWDKLACLLCRWVGGDRSCEF